VRKKAGQVSRGREGRNDQPELLGKQESVTISHPRRAARINTGEGKEGKGVGRGGLFRTKAGQETTCKRRVRSSSHREGKEPVDEERVSAMGAEKLLAMGTS